MLPSEPQITYQQAYANLCAGLAILVSGIIMADSRIEQALARIEAALGRMDAAHARVLAQDTVRSPNGDGSGSARVMTLVNSHEKLREEVADTLRDLDALIEELGG